MLKKTMMTVGRVVFALFSLIATAVLAFVLLTGSGSVRANAGQSGANAAIMDRYDTYINNRMSNALEGILAIEKVYWLSDDDQIAPKPDPTKYGRTTDPSSLEWLMEDAAKILDGQETIFNTDIDIARGSEVIYYLDETIFAVTWKEGINGVVYTFSEVKIAHPSQFRRFLAGGEYGADVQLVTTEMAKTVNAVVASSGDFYNFRRVGVIVYNGQVRRVNSKYVDTCYINEKGDLLFSYAGQIPDMKVAEKFAEENNVRFSLAFGPILIDKGVYRHVDDYTLGEINRHYSRAALSQKGELHYLLTTANDEDEYGYPTVPTLFEFAQVLLDKGVDMAYTLDGGQTAAIVTNNKLINDVDFDSQRAISDIIYFATAVPDGN